MSYDDWRVNGEWHLCECGRKWSDSDGGPCHVKCVLCEELFDPSEISEEDLCEKCESPKVLLERIRELDDKWGKALRKANELQAEIRALNGTK